jgi:H+/gluconate symporter-like permease
VQTIQTLGILLGILAIIYTAMRGLSIVVAAPLSAILIIVTNRMDFFASLVGRESSYLTGLTGFVVNYLPVFMLGAILAKYMEESGAAQSIAQKIIEKTGSDRPFPVLIALFVITAILTYGGISLFVAMFVLVPLAKPLFKRLNIAWNLLAIPVFVGLGTFTMTMLPGTPSIQNVVPTAYLNTTLTAAPLLGTIGSIVAVAFGLWYMKVALNKSIAQGETFSDTHVGDSDSQPQREIPPFFISVLPVTVLIAVIWAGSLLKVANIILIGLALAVVLSALLFNRWIADQKAVINQGAAGSIMPVFVTASTVGFGVVITLAPGFKYISELILGVPGDPLISLSVASAAFGGITGSSSGALGIVMEAFAKSYLQMGIDPELLHRVSAIASSVFTVTPQSGALLTFYAVTGLTHKNSFKHPFIAMTGGNLLALIVVLLTAIIIY